MKKTIVTLVLVFALAAPVYAFSPANILEQFKSFFGVVETSIEETYQEIPTELQELEQEPILVPETLIEVPPKETPTEVPETPSTLPERPTGQLPETPTEEVSETTIETGFIIVPIDGKCPEEYLTSEDNKRCIKLVPPSPIPEVPVESTIEGGYVILPKDGKCPDGYTLRGDGKICIKPPVPTIFIAPKESFKEVIFNPGENVIIKDKNINKEAVIAPEEGFKAIISFEFEGEKQAVTPQDITIQSGVEPGRITLSVGQIFASTKEPVEIRENKIFLKEKEIKFMPDMASEIATEKLEGLGFNIELKDVGTRGVVQPVYEVIAVKDVKILGLFNAKMKVKTEVDAQTGEASEIKRSWWSFLVR